MRVVVRGGVKDLAADLKRIDTQAPKDFHRKVREGIRVGSTVMRDLTKVRGGSHSGVSKKGVRPLVKSIGSDMILHGGFGLYAGEVGPDESLPQGRVMRALERGTRYTKPKRIVKNTGDLIGPALHGEVRDLVRGYFWPGAR